MAENSSLVTLVVDSRITITNAGEVRKEKLKQFKKIISELNEFVLICHGTTKKIVSYMEESVGNGFVAIHKEFAPYNGDVRNGKATFRMVKNMKQKVFITKYALTSGIQEAQMEVKLSDSPTNKNCHGLFNGSFHAFYGDEFHLTKDEAVKDAEIKRKKKIDLLKKQILKLENLTF